MAQFSHIDADGKAVMVDVTNKNITERTATAKGSVFMQPETVRRIIDGREIAYIVTFLASPKAGAINGDVIAAGGGAGRGARAYPPLMCP